MSNKKKILVRTDSAHFVPLIYKTCDYGTVIIYSMYIHAFHLLDSQIREAGSF